MYFVEPPLNAAQSGDLQSQTATIGEHRSWVRLGTNQEDCITLQKLETVR